MQEYFLQYIFLFYSFICDRLKLKTKIICLKFNAHVLCFYFFNTSCIFSHLDMAHTFYIYINLTYNWPAFYAINKINKSLGFNVSVYLEKIDCVQEKFVFCILHLNTLSSFKYAIKQ